LLDNPKDPKKAGEGQFSDKQLSSQKSADKLVSSNDTGQLTIRNLLKKAPVGVDDKLTTIKAAHRVDKERFQSAFRSLMGDAKS
tara:strand:+ start:292 stop:543 length:252 start_codon:yes stop_codon:yes gene_type:complete